MDPVCPSCTDGGLPTQKLTTGGQVFLALGALAVLGVFGVHPAGGFLATLVGGLVAWWFLRTYGYEVRCGRCGALALERQVVVQDLRRQRDDEVARLKREKATERERERERDKQQNRAAKEISEALVGRVLWVRASADDETALRVVTELPAGKMEAILLSRGAVSLARQAGFSTILIHGSMNKDEYARLEIAAIDAFETDDKVREEIADHAIKEMEERDLLVVRL